LPDDAFVVCMTMGHATDRPILEEIFRSGRRFPFLGVIGSKAKRAVLVKELKAAGILPERVDDFQCPIGLELGTNQPGEIAISVVAQLIQERDRWRSTGEASGTRGASNAKPPAEPGAD
jgi:xanthine dehydrogenase accessory factor